MLFDPSLEEIIEFIRYHQGISEARNIDINTKLEDDLGISGDDGVELLEALEDKYIFSFAPPGGDWRDPFGIEKDQFLFHGEGTLADLHPKKIVPISVGRLYQAILIRLRRT